MGSGAAADGASAASVRTAVVAESGAATEGSSAASALLASVVEPGVAVDNPIADSIRAFPALLTPIVANYAMHDIGGVMRTEIAGGPSRYTLDWDDGMQQFQVTLILNALKFSVWETFYHHQIHKGAVAFDMPLDSGFGVQPHVCHIVPGSYSATRTEGIIIVVSFVVETQNDAYQITAEDAQTMIDVYNEYGINTNAHLARIAQFALVDTLVLP